MKTILRTSRLTQHVVVFLDIDECQDPAIKARCVENSECCNLPSHYVCKCNQGYEGDGEVSCTGKLNKDPISSFNHSTKSILSDINECLHPNACGVGAECFNTPGNYTCVCPEGTYGDPYSGCADIDECANPNACGPGALCTNLEGGYRCDCPQGFHGDARSVLGCTDMDECAKSPCGRNALCINEVGSFKCACPDGFVGDASSECIGKYQRLLIGPFFN